MKPMKTGAVVALAAISISACQNFFTTSWAASLARNQTNLVPEVTTANLGDLVALTDGNPKLAATVLDGIATAAATATAEDLAALRSAAIEVADTASGLGGALMAHSAETLEKWGDGSDIMSATVKTGLIDIAEAAFDELPLLVSSATALKTILPVLGSEDFTAYAAAAEPADLAMAAFTLVAAEAAADPAGLDAYIASLETKPIPAMSATVQLAAALAKAADERFQAAADDGLLASILADLRSYNIF